MSPCIRRPFVVHLDLFFHSTGRKVERRAILLWIATAYFNKRSSGDNRRRIRKFLHRKILSLPKAHYQAVLGICLCQHVLQKNDVELSSVISGEQWVCGGLPKA
ncbi:MAG: hypothetical protein Udaeo2_30510 [Candidatus Udaeobacter sp.]|nr:MAG: hypothetical protein Udaeo2_30510 [Candidatus Udaeobacter sp.]